MKIREGISYTPAMHQWYGILEYLGYDVHYEDYSEYQADDFYKKMKTLKPDYIFHPTYENFHTEFIRLREFSKVYLLHSDDDWRFDNYAKHWIHFTDGAIGYQNNEQSYLNAGAPKGYYNRAKWSFNTSMMIQNFDSQKSYELTHVGGLHGNKQSRIDQLNTIGLKINLIPLINNFSEYLETYHKSIMSLCLTSNSINTGNQSKTRLVEMPYYCVLVSESWPNMELWNMEPGKDFIMIDYSNDSFIDQIYKCSSDNLFAKKMFLSGRRVLLENNTGFHEWNRIMRNIDPDYKPVDVSLLLKKLDIL